MQVLSAPAVKAPIICPGTSDILSPGAASYAAKLAASRGLQYSLGGTWGPSSLAWLSFRYPKGWTDSSSTVTSYTARCPVHLVSGCLRSRGPRNGGHICSAAKYKQPSCGIDHDSPLQCLYFDYSGATVTLYIERARAISNTSPLRLDETWQRCSAPQDVHGLLQIAFIYVSFVHKLSGWQSGRLIGEIWTGVLYKRSGV